MNAPMRAYSGSSRYNLDISYDKQFQYPVSAYLFFSKNKCCGGYACRNICDGLQRLQSFQTSPFM